MSLHAASNNPWLDDAIEGISSQDIYIDSGVKGAGDLQAALEQVVPDDGSIAVVVLPAAANGDTPYNTYILEQLTGTASQKTVIVAVGTDLTADSAVIGQDALRIANENEGSAATTQDALVETVVEIIQETPASSGSGGEVAATGAALPLIIGGVVLIAAAVSTIGIVARRRRNKRATTASIDPLPTDIRLRVNRLRELRVAYAAVGGNAVAAETAAGIDALASHIEQLFVRLDAKGGQEQTGIAEAEYSDKLARLVAALERDYLLDLITHPDLWDDPQERIAEVQDALAAMTTQIVDNIKQVNARTALRFQVSLDSLIGRSELRDWERQFNTGSDET